MVDPRPIYVAVLVLVTWLSEERPADAPLIAELLGISETTAARVLDDLEAAGYLSSAPGPVP